MPHFNAFLVNLRIKLFDIQEYNFFRLLNPEGSIQMPGALAICKDVIGQVLLLSGLICYLTGWLV